MVSRRWVTKKDGRGRPRSKKLNIDTMSMIESPHEDRRERLQRVTPETSDYVAAGRVIFPKGFIYMGLILYAYEIEFLSKSNYVKFFSEIVYMYKEPPVQTHSTKVSLQPQERDVCRLLTYKGATVDEIIVGAIKAYAKHEDMEQELEFEHQERLRLRETRNHDWDFEEDVDLREFATLI